MKLGKLVFRSVVAYLNAVKCLHPNFPRPSFSYERVCQDTSSVLEIKVMIWFDFFCVIAE